MGTSRSAFEARSISFASLVRSLYFRLHWGREGNNALGVRVCVGGAGCKREERAERQASTNQTRSADGTGSFYRPQDLPAQRSCLVSLGSQRTAKHMRQQVLGRVLMSVDCMRVLLHLLDTHHSAPQWASTCTYVPLTCTQTTCTQKHHPRPRNSPDREAVWRFESASYTKDMLARGCHGARVRALWRLQDQACSTRD